MPSIQILKDTIKPEYLEQIKTSKSKIQDGIDKFKEETLQTIEKTFGIRPNLEDPRLSEAAKQI
ncbi:MAG: hypothetical protein WAZ12_01840 [Candidatus Absconditicoccaceae bacterium]